VIHTIRGRQTVAFAILLLGLLAAGMLGVSALKGLSRDFDEGMAQVRRVSEIGTQLERDVLDLIFAAEGYLATGSRESKRQFTDLAGRTQEVAKQYRSLEGLPAAEVQQVQRLTTLLTQLEVEYARAHALYDVGQHDEAQELVHAATPLAAEVASLISALGERQTQALAESTAALRDRAGKRANVMTLILFLALGLGAALAYITLRSIDRPLAQLVSAAAELGEGHLKTKVGSNGMPKEFAAVATAFDKMAGGLRGLAGQVVATASQVSSSAADFSAISEQVAASTNEVAMAMSEISEGADRQAGALNETAAAVVQLREGTTEIETQAGRNRELSHSILREAGQSQESVRQALALLLALRGVVHETNEEIEELVAASDKITGFVKAITSIAEQTHLLSLNAAIEAAHAGHEGRGFGVVAEEVRKLASEADIAAQDVEDVVAQLRDSVSAAAAKMQRGESQVVQVEGVARGAEGALDAIAEGLDRVTQATDHAVETAQRSRTLLEQVSVHVESVTATATAHASRSQDVSAAVQEQSATTQQISASVTQLVSVADELRRIVGEWEV
jgi:methyl-accepting chemotaxis protein